MQSDLVCWKCGASLAALPLPLGRSAECLVCRAELHVCRMCRFYDPSVSQSCQEPIAEAVNDKLQANFCGYFEAKPNAHEPGNRDATTADRAKLDALFGTTPEPRWSEPGHEKQPIAEVELAEKRLDDLFKS